MELVDKLRGKIICIDTAPFIYFIEKDPKYLNIVRPIFAEIDAGNIEALTSTITNPMNPTNSKYMPGSEYESDRSEIFIQDRRETIPHQR